MDELAVDGSRVTAKANPVFHERFLRDDLFVEYDRTVSLEGLDQSILAIPFLLNVLPLVWLSGETYYIDRMDAQLAQALETIRATFRKLHPDFAWDGALIAEQTVEPPRAIESDARALLFTGGVDSMHAHLVHQGKPQVLFTILRALGGGPDSARHGRVNSATRKYVQAFANELGHRSSFATSNAVDFISTKKLVGTWPRPRRWLIELQYGLGFVGVAAPLVQQLGLAKLVMAGCELDHYGLPSGSHPDIVNKVAWSGTTVCMEGLGQRRQHKVHALLESLSAGHPGGVELKPCLFPSDEFENCCNCSKCLQTILGILGDAGDPGEFGFSVEPQVAFRRLREQLDLQRLSLPDIGELLQWMDIQSAIRQILTDPLSAQRWADKQADGAEWFAKYDFVQYFARHHSRNRRALRSARMQVGLYLDSWPALGRVLRRVLNPLLRPFLKWR
ncbi:hypothetical protein ACFLRV_00025 [Candidatus Bipolaricaulota bacterium]